MRVHQPVQEMEQLVLLVSTLRKESMVAHQLLQSYRLLLGSTKLIMERRIPACTTKVKVRNTCDKAAIAGMVAELTKLERLYSPHKVPTEGDDRVRGSLCDEVDVPRLGQGRVCTQGSPHTAEVDVPGLGQGRECTQGSLRTKVDVPGLGQERECTQGSLRAEVDIPRLGQGRGCTKGSLHAAEVDVPRLGQGGGHTNGSPYPSVDWDSMARLSVSQGSLGLSIPGHTLLPVHACNPLPKFPNDQDLSGDEFIQKREEHRQAAIRTYNPMGSPYKPPAENATKEPFGSISGFHTNLGPIPFPRGPVKGYIWDPVHQWVLHASPPGQRRRGSRR